MANGGGQRRRRPEMVDRPFAKVGEVRREIACKTEIEGVRSRKRKRKRERERWESVKNRGRRRVGLTL